MPNLFTEKSKVFIFIITLALLWHFVNANNNTNINNISINNSETQQKQEKSETVKQTFTTISNTYLIDALPKVKAFSENVDKSKPYCDPSLCELYNGTHLIQELHTGCQNNGSFGPACGEKPHLLVITERRRNLILDMHNLARSHIASGQIEGYKSASHMPILKWDNELEYLASLHVRRCRFAHDKCRNTLNYKYSGQNIGYFWIARDFKSHSRRMKSFIIDWFREYKDANQTFIDSYNFHPEGKKIGHFTMVVSDRAHRVGCAAVRFTEPGQPEDRKFLMTCNYDFNNILGEPVYQTGPTASECIDKVSKKFPALCDWKYAVYEYENKTGVEDGNNMDDIIDLNILKTNLTILNILKTNL